MTDLRAPKNRAELDMLIADAIIENPPSTRLDAIDALITADHIQSALDAAGLAIVPKEPTDWMSQAGIIAALSKAEVDPDHNLAEHLPTYRAMLEASPYRGPPE